MKSNDNINKDAHELLSATDDEVQKTIINEQLIAIKNSNTELAWINTLSEKLIKSENRAEQNDIVFKINAAKTRVMQLENQFNQQSESLAFSIEQNHPNLKNGFDKKPFETLLTLKETNEQMKDLTGEDLKYISTSKFISRAYGKLLRSDPDKFVACAIEQLHHAKSVASKSGAFVEVDSCENWGDTPIFENGAVVHPKVANQIIEQAEMQIRGLKLEAKSKSDYYPYTKCDITVYSPTNNGLSALNTRIDIGDGEQNNLTDHLTQICQGDEKAKVLENFNLAKKESDVSDKIKSPYKLKNCDLKPQSYANWKNQIESEKHNESSKEMEILENDKEGTPPERGE
jgi:hypothetical protein